VYCGSDFFLISISACKTSPEGLATLLRNEILLLTGPFRVVALHFLLEPVLSPETYAALAAM
jgi:hypothetical protein